MGKTSLNSFDFDRLYQEARGGSESAVARLLEPYRNYLCLLARVQIGKDLQVRVSPSDVAQESLVAAQSAFRGFRGSTENELLAWLRKVLASRLVDAQRFHSAKRRDVHAEERINAEVEKSSLDLGALVASHQESPSQIVARREQTLLLAEALKRLPSDYSEVIVQRHLEGRSFAEVASTMNRSVSSIKGIWARAMTRLRDELQETAE